VTASRRHDLRIINDVLCTLHRWYKRTCRFSSFSLSWLTAARSRPASGRSVGAQRRSSRRLYRDFVAPLDDEVLSVYPHGGMIHLCGAHTQHIPVWHEMASLRALQFTDRAAEDLPIYAETRRPDQMLYVRPVKR